MSALSSPRIRKRGKPTQAVTCKGADYAAFLRLVCDEWFPHSELIVLGEGNLNPHTDASLYTTFAPAEVFRLARRLARRCECHRTAVHGIGGMLPT